MKTLIGETPSTSVFDAIRTKQWRVEYLPAMTATPNTIFPPEFAAAPSSRWSIALWVILTACQRTPPELPTDYTLRFRRHATGIPAL